jgi:hypothetical protein
MRQVMIASAPAADATARPANGRPDDLDTF